MLVGNKKLNGVILTETTSTSGKYKLFFLVHFTGKEYCYDVGTRNLQTGEVTREHHPGNKEEGLRYWEIFRTKMTERAQEEEQNEEKQKFIVH